MKKKLLALSIGLSLSAVAAAAPDQWHTDPHFDPAYGKLAAPRTDSHPIDTMVFLSEYGIESAQQTLAEWEADPAWRERLYQRPAYRQYARDRAQARLRVRLAEAAAPESEAEPDIEAEEAQPRQDKVASTAPSHRRQMLERSREDRLEIPVVDFDSELVQLRSTIRTLTVERDELAARLAMLEEEHAALQLAHGQLKKAHEELQGAHQRVLAENESLSRKYTELQERYDMLRSEHQALLATLRRTPGEPESMAGPAIADQERIPPVPEPTTGSAGLPAREPEERGAMLAVIHRQEQTSQEAIELNRRGLAALDDGDAASAVRWFLRAARAGSANAMNNLGYLYEKGWGTLPSAQEAALWYSRAAEAGHVHAMRNLARCFEEGVGVLPDADRAAQWRQRAAAAEHKLSQASSSSETGG